FIDLPSDVFLALQDVEAELHEQRRRKLAEAPPAEEPHAAVAEERPSIYQQYADRAGEVDHETYWERHFEHNLSDDAYRLAAYEFGNSIRELEEDQPRWRAENLVREAYMRRKIEGAIAAGTSPEKIVAVVGAFHAPVLSGEHPAMTDSELA